MDISLFILTTASSRHAAAGAQRLLKMQGLSAQQHDGVEQNSIRMLADERIGSQTHSYRTRGHRMPASEKARYLSHYRLLKHALKHKIKHIVVMEPNTLPTPHFKAAISAISAADRSCEFAHLAMTHIPLAVHKDQRNWLQTLTPNCMLAPCLDTLPNTSAYYLSLQGLRKIVPLLMPIRADLPAALANTLWTGPVRGFQTWPQAVFNSAHAAPAWRPARYHPALRITRDPAGVLIRKLAAVASRDPAARPEHRLKAFQQQSEDGKP